MKQTQKSFNSTINKVSDKQEMELALRQKIKAELIKEFGNHCMSCNNKYRDWRGLSLSHIIPLSRGGKTTRENCILECYPDHELYEKHPENRPLWQQIQAGVISNEEVPDNRFRYSEGCYILR